MRLRLLLLLSCRVCTIVHVLQRIPSAATSSLHKESRSEDSHLQLVLLLCAGPSWIFHSPGASKASALHIFTISGSLSGVLTTPCRFDVPLNHQQQQWAQCGCAWESAKSCSNLFCKGRMSCWSHLDVRISNCVRIKRHCEVIDNSDVTRWLRLATFSLRTAFNGSVCYMEMN